MLRFRNRYGNVENTLEISEAVLGKQLADLEEQRVILKSRLDSKEIDEATWSKEDKELEAQMMETCEAKGAAASRMTMREMIIFGDHAKRKNEAIEIYNLLLDKANTVMTNEVLGTQKNHDDIKITAEEFIRVWNVAGYIVDSDIAQVADFVDASIYYNWRPIDLLNVITKRAITNETIKFRFEDTSKVEGAPEFINKATELPRFDYGTEEQSRKLKLIGSQIGWDLSIETNSDEAGFLPQALMWGQHLHNQVISAQMISGNGRASGVSNGNTAQDKNMRGFLNENGVQTAATVIAAGPWDRAKLEVFADAIAGLRENQFVNPTHVVVSPWDHLRMQLVWEDSVGYILANKPADTPLGDQMTQLFGIPVITSYWVPENTIGGKTGRDFICADFRNTALYTNGGMIQSETGKTKDDLVKLQRTHIQYCRVNQFTKDGSKIVKVRRTEQA